jgi:hypothetical protein
MKLALVPNQRSMVFEICPKLTYSAQSEFMKLSLYRNKLMAIGAMNDEIR